MQRNIELVVRCIAVIPARRAEATIRATLESLRLGNDACVERVLVVTSDDDPTADIVRHWNTHDPRVVLVGARSVRSAGAARNDGRRAAASGVTALAGAPGAASLLLFVDADCQLEAGGAARLASELEQTGAAAVTSRVLAEAGAVAGVRHMLEFKEAASLRPAPDRWLPPSTVMLCRADAFDRAGGFPDLWPGEDLVFAQALRDLGERIRRSDRVVAVHRHPPGVVEMLRHQHRLGRTAAIARSMREMPGSLFARHRALAVLLLPARLVRIALWQLGEGRTAASKAALLWPLVACGLVAWTAGFLMAPSRASLAASESARRASFRRSSGCSPPGVPV